VKIGSLMTLVLCIVMVGCTAPPSSEVTAGKESMSKSYLPQQPLSTSKTFANYPDLGLAPELENTDWLNTNHPLRLKELRGQVVLLEMWTFGCINCQDVMPSLKAWYQKYHTQGFEIIGNHFPEFAFEKDLDNLKNAVQQDQIVYPVAQDNDGKTWTAYHNAYWPTLYLIDKRGHIRYTHIGEGAYDTTQIAIEALLNEPG
jgi:thiol-disulfide isomerase/thioredoxin